MPVYGDRGWLLCLWHYRDQCLSLTDSYGIERVNRMNVFIVTIAFNFLYVRTKCLWRWSWHFFMWNIFLLNISLISNTSCPVTKGYCFLDKVSQCFKYFRYTYLYNEHWRYLSGKGSELIFGIHIDFYRIIWVLACQAYHSVPVVVVLARWIGIQMYDKVLVLWVVWWSCPISTKWNKCALLQAR